MQVREKKVPTLGLTKVEEVPLAKKHLLHCLCATLQLVCYTVACVLQAPGNNSKCDLQLELCLCAALDCSAPLLKGGQTEESVAL